MGYRAQPHHNNPNLWRVLWRKYQKIEAGEWVPDERHIPETEYLRLGIKKSMSLKEAQEILRKINLEKNRRQLEEKRNRIAQRLAAEKEIECIHLPPLFVQKFENDHLAVRYIGNDDRLKKVLKLWRAAQRVIRTIPKPMDQWFRYPQFIYAYSLQKSWSLGYSKNVLSTLNMWIDYLGVETGINYRPVPSPDNIWQARINNAFEESGNGKAAFPITPEELENVSPPLITEQWNWVYCTIWAGLRPNEASSLLNPKKTRITFEDKTPILEIYQSKLKNVPKSEDRWKRIPLFLLEQTPSIEEGSKVHKMEADRNQQLRSLIKDMEADRAQLRSCIKDLFDGKISETQFDVAEFDSEAYSKQIKQITKDFCSRWAV